MNFTVSKILLFFILLYFSGCFFKPSQEPLMYGPAFIFNNEDSYYALFPRTHRLLFGCGDDNLDSQYRINLTQNFILENEEPFRESYYKLIVGPAENLHPDSAAYTIENPGEYGLIRKVTHREMLRKSHEKYFNSIDWDRQYFGFINDKKDTVLLINMVDPKRFSRKGLGHDMMFGGDAAYEHISTVAYNLSDKSVTFDFCSAVKSQ